jgi:hypothetical protein
MALLSCCRCCKADAPVDKLRLMLLLLLWLAGTMATYGWLGVFGSEYFRVGPSPTLEFLGTPIDSWHKWAVLVLFRAASPVFEVATMDMVGPWMLTRLQDEDKLDLPYPKWKCSLIVQLYFLYGNVNGVFALFLTLTQADIAAVEIISHVVVVQAWTLPQWMRGKAFAPRRRGAAAFHTLQGGEGDDDSGGASDEFELCPSRAISVDVPLVH